MDSFNLRELKALQDENRSLKQMCAELSLDYQLTKSVIEKSFKALSKARAGRVAD
jgi:hypothetical protein